MIDIIKDCNFLSKINYEGFQLKTKRDEEQYWNILKIMFEQKMKVNILANAILKYKYHNKGVTKLLIKESMIILSWLPDM